MTGTIAVVHLTALRIDDCHLWHCQPLIGANATATATAYNWGCLPQHFSHLDRQLGNTGKQTRKASTVHGPPKSPKKMPVLYISRRMRTPTIEYDVTDLLITPMTGDCWSSLPIATTNDYQ